MPRDVHGGISAGDERPRARHPRGDGAYLAGYPQAQGNQKPGGRRLHLERRTDDQPRQVGNVRGVRVRILAPRKYSILRAGGALILVSLLLAQCAANVPTYTYKDKLLAEADSLFREGNYEYALRKYAKARDEYPKTAVGARAQYSLGYVNVYYDNPFADYNAALREFKRFAATYPGDKRIDMVNNWIRILTILQDFGKSYYGSNSQLRKLKNRQSSIFKNYSTLQDAYLRCDRLSDSLTQRIRILEGIIAELDKIR
ncbi:MAG: outer membrane protein assembly factor BamD [Chitinivibrionales bacterium]|nr:outer membrane protein assembly factor BamD [Chitinivibrionales bacterium]MBD3396352.1 outer membrane protein assembly factor BamD [Chitinivibrionales bacterium]